MIDDRVDRVDMLALLIPDANQRRRILDAATSEGGAPEQIETRALTLAYHGFRSEVATLAPERQRARRDEIQDEIFRASEQRCNAYKRYLHELQAETQFTFGALTTILGGAGALVSSATAARVLAGTAGITSGVEAEFQEALFRKLVIEVIIEGMDLRRKAVFDTARTQRRSSSLDDYTIEHAMLDGIRFHGECSLMSGLRSANDSIREVRHPGPETMKATIKKFGEIRSTLNETIQDRFDRSGAEGGQGAASDATTLSEFAALPRLTDTRIEDGPKLAIQRERNAARSVVGEIFKAAQSKIMEIGPFIAQTDDPAAKQSRDQLLEAARAEKKKIEKEIQTRKNTIDGNAASDAGELSRLQSEIRALTAKGQLIDEKVQILESIPTIVGISNEVRVQGAAGSLSAVIEEKSAELVRRDEIPKSAPGLPNSHTARIGAAEAEFRAESNRLAKERRRQELGQLRVSAAEAFGNSLDDLMVVVRGQLSPVAALVRDGRYKDAKAALDNAKTAIQGIKIPGQSPAGN